MQLEKTFSSIDFVISDDSNIHTWELTMNSLAQLQYTKILCESVT